MKTRKTKKRNIIRRAVAFLLCMTMVLGLGMQDVMEQVYAEEPVSTLTEESDTPAEESTEPKEDSEQEESTEPKKDSEQGETTETKEESVITEEPKKDTSSDTSTVPGGTAPVEEGSTDGNTTPATPNDNTTPAGTTETNTEASGSKSPAQTTPDGNTTSTVTGEATTEVTDPSETTEKSDPSEVTEPEEADENLTPEEETAKPYEAEKKVDNVTIHVSAEAGVLPEDAELSVTQIVKKEITENMSEEEKAKAEEINAQYEETEQKLTEQLQEEAAEEAATLAAENASAGVNAVSETTNADTEAPVVEKTLKGFLSYDISFLGENGEEIEPEGEVQVSFEFAEAALPDETSENMEVAVKHFKEEKNADGEEEIVVEDLTEAETTNIETEGENGAAVTKVELVADSFSEYTIVWYESINKQYNKDSVEICYINTDGEEIFAFLPDEDLKQYGEEQPIILEESEYNVDIEGYHYLKAVLAWDRYSALQSQTVIQKLMLHSSSGMFGTRWSIQYQGEYGNWSDIAYGQKIYIIYEPDPDTPGGGAVGDLAHRKYVEDNGDGTYDLTLDVTGAVGTETDPAKVDVVFVLDLSSSMDGEIWMNHRETTILQAAKNAMKTLTSTVSQAKTIDARWKLVTFDTNAHIVTGWVNANQIDSKIDQQWQNDDGGTNYERGLTQASNALADARKDATKVVIFLTDGEPTMCQDYTGRWWEDSCGSDHTESCDYHGALDGAAKIKCDRFFAVGIGLSTDSVYTEDTDWGQDLDLTGEELLEKVAEKVQALPEYKQVVNVTDGDSLNDVFAGIAGSINSYKAANVHISDQLTEEVDPVEDYELVVQVLDKNGTEHPEEIAQGGIYAKYNEETKELELFFNEKYTLKEGYTYSVTITIKPNNIAVELYKNNNYTYPHTGGEGTGETSEGKPGIFTNEDGATVTWKVNGEGETKTGTYEKPVVQLETEPTPPPIIEKELSREKYVKYNGDGTYDLTLNVSGQVGSLTQQTKVDVVLLVDVSTSMSYDYDNWHDYSRIAKAKEAVAALTATLEGKNVDSNWKVLTFGKTASDLTSAGWVTAQEANSKVNGIQISNGVGTNYEAGFIKTVDVLSEARNDAEKVVIFLTDGAPTYAGQSGNIGRGSATTQEILNSTYSSAMKISCSQFYAVGVGLGNVEVERDYWDGGNYDTTGNEILTEIKDNVTAPSESKKVYNTADDNTDLTEIFADIAGSITSFLCSDVTVTDNLSEWAEVADLNANDGLQIRVTKTVNGQEQEVDEGRGTVSSGVSVTLGKTTTNETATLRAYYNEDEKQVILDFPDDYQLEADYTYYVTVKIAPTIEAYEKYQELENSYPKDMIGDEGTDAEGNDTSSNQPGFYSNDEATVTYTYNGIKESADYLKPVIQVGDMTTEDTPFITVSKTFDGLTKEQVGALKERYADGDNSNDFVITVTSKEDADKSKELRLNELDVSVSSDGLTYTWKLENFKSGEYKVEEMNAEIENYKLDTTGIGESIDIKDTDWIFVRNVEKVEMERSSVERPFELNENSILMIALRNPGQYLVWTKNPLSASQQKAIEDAINTGNDFIDFRTGNVEKIYFHSGEEKLKDGIAYGGSEVIFQNGQYGNSKLIFSPVRQWKNVLVGNYTLTGKAAGDINVKNTYTLETVDIDFQKFGTTYEMEQLDAKFRLEKMNTEINDDQIKITTVSEDLGEKTVSSTLNDFDPLGAGVYRLTETEAPEGYSLLDDAIYFSIDGINGVQLLTVDENDIISVDDDGRQDMFELEVTEEENTKKYTIKIKNNTLYDLPQAGGPGIYLYMLGGVALMMAGTLLVYKKRKEEVLRS